MNSQVKRLAINLVISAVSFGIGFIVAVLAYANEPAQAQPANTHTAIATAHIVTIAQSESNSQEMEWLVFEATAYCECEICCGRWAIDRPGGIVYTASGAIAKAGVTIAADWDVMPKGTQVYIEGIGSRTVQDRGGAIKGNIIDIYFDTHEEALQFGRQEVRLYILGED